MGLGRFRQRRHERDVNMWHPVHQGNLYPLGTFAESGPARDINGKRASLLVGANPNTKPSKPAVARPSDYTLIWRDEGTKSDGDGSFWRPIAPAGYVSLGDVAVTRWDKPPLDKIWCVREDLAGWSTFLASSIWDDLESGGDIDGSCWSIVPSTLGIEGSPNIPIVADAFRAENGYTRPDSKLARILVLPIGNHYKKFKAPMPEITPDTIPDKGEQYDRIEQCKVTLPFHCFFEPTDQSSLDNISDPFCSISRSIAWHVEGVWVNRAAGSFTHETRLLCGVSKEKREEMAHSVGVEVSASYGVGLASGSVSLNYQFTSNTATSFTEFSQREVKESFVVDPHSAKVLLSKHVWIQVSRLDPPIVLNQMEIVASDAIYFTGCPMPNKAS